MSAKPVKPIPEGYHTITPFLIAKEASQLLEFMKQAFGATERSVHRMQDGTIMHAELQIGNSLIMMSEATERYPAQTAMLHLYMDDCDVVYQAAMKAGGISLREPTDEFYGDRSCGVSDAAGNQWWIATHIEDVPAEEIQRRSEEWAKSQAQNQK